MHRADRPDNPGDTEPDFAEEHDAAGFADDEPQDGPEHARDESVPAGLAGADPTGTDE